MNAVITGAASGIGAAVAEALVARGDRVLACDINADALHALADRWPDELLPHRLDVRDSAGWEAALDAAEQRFGRVDVVMNIAGFLEPDFVVAASDDAIDRHFDINVKGVVLGTRAAARRMVARRAGHIINVGSLASLAPVPGLSLYAASKFAVRGFTLSAAAELAPQGVGVTLVLPDAVETPMLELQVGRDEAAMTFSGRTLTVAQVRDEILRALTTRQVEVTIPPSRGRLAKVATLWPAAGIRLMPLFRALGRRGQRKARL